MIEYFNGKMQQSRLSQAPGPPILAVQVNHDKNFAFLEVSGVLNWFTMMGNQVYDELVHLNWFMG